ncbi:cation:proton antiporter [Ruania albidiflava]|uniref:cation:proton antiporter n=1 Tax=Ruania albidiflava TaxID=366586 RepID=UPI0003B54D89|nr:sodium:proton antiporter [Ruania albidiflava]
MDFAWGGAIAIVTIVLVTRFSTKLGVAAPLVLVLVGVAFSLVPGTPAIELEPEWILIGVLPPLLYSAAVTVPIIDLRRNLKAISSLSVVLVIVSTGVSGYVLYLVFPNLELAPAFALGAVISPPDAVAATAVGKRLGLPPRLVTVLEGEGLVNDATALVLLRTAIGATAAAVTFWEVLGDFVLAVLSAVVVGLVIGYLAVAVRSRLDNPVLTTAVSFAVPFLAYLPAEQLHASGVLAVVLAGLVTGHRGAKLLTAQDRISERLNWRTIQFVLENGVFLLLGVELKPLVEAVQEDRLGVGFAVLVGLLATAVLIVVRVLFMVPLVATLRRETRRAAEHGPRLATMAERMNHAEPADERLRARLALGRRFLARRQADIDFAASQGLSWRGGAVLAWAGMRGVITLAAAQTLPRDLPYRPQLVLVAFTVSVATLLLQGSTLPMVIRRLHLRGTDAEAHREELASLLEEVTQAGLAAISDEALATAGEEVDPAVLERVRNEARLRVAAAREADSHGTYAQYRALRRRALDAERGALLEARSIGARSSGVLAEAQALLDQEESRLWRGPEH